MITYDLSLYIDYADWNNEFIIWSESCLSSVWCFTPKIACVSHWVFITDTLQIIKRWKIRAFSCMISWRVWATEYPRRHFMLWLLWDKFYIWVFLHTLVLWSSQFNDSYHKLNTIIIISSWWLFIISSFSLCIIFIVNKILFWSSNILVDSCWHHTVCSRVLHLQEKIIIMSFKSIEYNSEHLQSLY